MPKQAYLSKHDVIRWFNSPTAKPTVADPEYWQDVPLSEDARDDLRWRLESIEADYAMEAEGELLLLVGTLCLRHGQSDLWRAICEAALEDAHPSIPDNERTDPFVYLQQLTARVRERPHDARLRDVGCRDPAASSEGQ
jgi:hypothetical protein